MLLSEALLLEVPNGLAAVDAALTDPSRSASTPSRPPI